MATDFSYDVFLSHSSKDNPVVRPLAERLRADGLSENRRRAGALTRAGAPLAGGNRRPPLIEMTSTQQQTQRTLLDWLRVEYSIEKPGNKLQALTELDSDTLVSEVKRIRGKKQPLTAAAVKDLRAEYTRTVEPAHALAAEALHLERSLNDLVNQAYGLTPAEIALMWQTAPPRMPIPSRANAPQISYER